MNIFSGCQDSGINLQYRHVKYSPEFYIYEKLGKFSQLVYCLLICPGLLSQANLSHEEKKGGENTQLKSEKSERTLFLERITNFFTQLN